MTTVTHKTLVDLSRYHTAAKAAVSGKCAFSGRDFAPGTLLRPLTCDDGVVREVCMDVTALADRCRYFSKFEETSFWELVALGVPVVLYNRLAASFLTVRKEKGASGARTLRVNNTLASPAQVGRRLGRAVLMGVPKGERFDMDTLAALEALA